MEQMIETAMELAARMCEARTSGQLTEFEHMMYEQLCRMIEAYARYHAKLYETALFDGQKKHMIAEAEHEKWRQSFLEKGIDTLPKEEEDE